MKTLKILFIALFLGGFSLNTIACDCITIDKPQEAFDKVDVIFAGTITDIIKTEGSVKVVFRTITAWKGVSDTTIIVDAGYSSCDWSFFKGNHYLIYGYSTGGNISTNLCTRTATIYNASEDLEFLAAKPKLFDLRGCLDINKIRREAMCTMDYTPVCGCNGITYSNGCRAKADGVLNWSEGKCE
ncbi:MAG: hypothetical protein ACJATA_000652 [Sphingobacteriales bacterium]|jgi:hypothetical protein